MLCLQYDQRWTCWGSFWHLCCRWLGSALLLSVASRRCWRGAVHLLLVQPQLLHLLKHLHLLLTQCLHFWMFSQWLLQVLLNSQKKQECTEVSGESNTMSLEEFEKEAFKKLERKTVFKRPSAGPKTAAKKTKATKDKPAGKTSFGALKLGCLRCRGAKKGCCQSVQRSKLWWFEAVEGGMECPCQKAWLEVIPFAVWGEANNWIKYPFVLGTWKFFYSHSKKQLKETFCKGLGKSQLFEAL